MQIPRRKTESELSSPLGICIFRPMRISALFPKGTEMSFAMQDNATVRQHVVLQEWWPGPGLCMYFCTESGLINLDFF